VNTAEQQHGNSSIPTWRETLHHEREEDYFKQILSFISKERSSGKVIYPPDSEIFNACKLTPLETLRVVILGQDPYHGPGQAHGLCFSVRPGVRPPPSLVNIFQELESDLGVARPSNGSLESWARSGVLLLNTLLTVEQGKPLSHQKIGWERFTDRIVDVVNTQREHIVFLLWGANAQKKGAAIDRGRHCVLTAPHPSPFSAHTGFLGCKHFSKANDYLTKHGLEPIDWKLS
jgi:uracil-DNA glycosylase